MARKFDVSFKNTTKENMMFDYFNNLEDRSTEIKNILYPWYVENILGKKKDVDLEKRTISITKSYQRLGKKDVITPPKTSKSKRVITIPEFLAAYIKDYMDSLYDLQEDDRLFPITKYYLEHEMQRGIKESGVKRIRVHDLRHSHASMLIELGFSPLEIANRLGHEKVETTLNTYAHLYPNKQTKLAERLDSEYREDL